MIEWKEVYSIGIESVDNQHKQLITYINELDEKINKLQREDVSLILFKLHQYAITHFTHEQKIMIKEKYDSDKLKQHIKEHESFSELVNSSYEKSKDLTFAFMVNVTILIKEWIIQHMLGTDREFELFMKEKNDRS